MLGGNTRRLIPLLTATLTIVGAVIANKLTESLDSSQSWGIVLAWMLAGIVVTYLVSRFQAGAQEQNPEAIKRQVNELESGLRKQVQTRSYGARSKLIENPLRQLDLDITPRLGWVRDPRLVEPEPLSEKPANAIVAAFESSSRRLLIVGEPGSGKTMTAYALIEYLDETEGNERIPLLVNLSAWEAQENFEAFLVDYLCSSVGYDVPERAVASAFVSSKRYSLILDGLDEIPVGLRKDFSERLDEFVRGLQSAVGVVVTCRTQEYEELRADYKEEGLGLVQAVEILPLTSEQLDCAFAALAKRDVGWETFLLQRDLTAYQRIRQLMSNPLFLNLAVAGRLSPDQLLDWSTTQQELQDLVIDGYLKRTLEDQSQYAPEDARHYLTWIACFLNGVEVSPFGLKTSDLTAFDLADLTPPNPPRRYVLYGAMVWAVVWAAGFVPKGDWIAGLGWVVSWTALWIGVSGWQTRRPFKRSAASTRLIVIWPSNWQQLLSFFRRARRGLIWGLVFGLFLGLGILMALGLLWVPIKNPPVLEVIGTAGFVLGMGLAFGLVLGLALAPGFGLLDARSVLVASRTPKESISRSMLAAMTWLVSGLIGGLAVGLVLGSVGFALLSSTSPEGAWIISYSLILLCGAAGLFAGSVLALHNGGWFVLLQKVAHRRLARDGNLPPRPYDFLEWGIERQIFRRVGGGVRFRHDLIQQHLASTPEGAAQG